MGLLRALARTFVDMCVVTLIIMFMPGFPPYNTFTPFELPDRPDWSGPMQPDGKLNLVDRLFENQIKGPESFAERDGFLYTGLMSGLIIKIDTEDLSFSPVARIGRECQGQFEDKKCGRPLGLQFTHKGDLLVCDAIFGLYLVKFNEELEDTTGRITSFRHHPHVSFEQLLDPEKLVDGSPNVILNSVVMDKDNRTVYVTVSSTKFPLRNALFELISDPTGRVLQIDLETRQVKVLKEGLNFANGIEIDSKGEYLLVTETGRAAIHKIFLKGPKKYECEKLDIKLPGLPDNIRLNERGNFYVGIISPRLPNTVHILELATTHNLIRKFVSRLIHMVLVPIKFINYIFPTTMTRKFEYWCGNFEPLAQLSRPYGLLIEVDGENENIVASLHSTNGATRFVSDAIVVGRWIYLGSPYTNYLARIPTRLLHVKTNVNGDMVHEFPEMEDPESSLVDIMEETLHDGNTVENERHLDNDGDMDYNEKLEL